MKSVIKITNAAFEEEAGDIVLRGRIEASSMPGLQIDKSYQREIMGRSHIRKIVKGFQAGGGIPDITISMRGGNFQELNDGSILLEDDCFIVDGQQRRHAAAEVLQGGIVPRLGAKIHFNKTRVWERDLFEALNTNQSRVGTNVLIRNLDGHQSVKLLLQLCDESSFALNKRVTWSHKMKRGELMNGQTFLRISTQLHNRLGKNVSATTTKYLSMADALEVAINKIGRKTVRENIHAFFEAVDQAFDIRNVTYGDRANHLKAGFLLALVSVFLNYQDFWEDTKLVVPTDLRKKLAKFPLNDPTVATLCGSVGKTQKQLYFLIVEHINSGKRTKRLTPFDNVTPISSSAYDDEADSDQDEAA